MIGANIEQHLIRKNHNFFYPSNILYLDTETEIIDAEVYQEHWFKLAWSCHVEKRPERKKDTETWLYFDKPWPMCDKIESLCRNNRPLWLFSHNLYFDLQVMCFFEYFPLHGWTLDFIYDKGLSYIIVIRKDKLTIKGVSTTNFFDVSLEKLGELLGYPKGKVDFSTVSMEELSAYCRRDVEILKRIMEDYMSFLKTNDLGKFSMTRASQSFAAYRHRFMTHKIFTHHEERIVALEKDAYVGGRVECFYIGRLKGRPIVSLDVNSMYPFVMKQFHFPYRFDAYYENLPLKYLPEILSDRCAVAEVLIETPDPHFALKRNGKLIFPVGRFRTFLCTRGLHFAQARGYVKSVIEIAVYRQAGLFSEYVDFFAALKERYEKEGNLVYRRFVKYFMNSLYGKFGQFRPVLDWFFHYGEPETFRNPFIDEVTGESGMEYKLFNKVFRETGKEIGNNSLVAIAAHITEDARMILDRLMSGIGREKILYCDTDGLKIFKRDMVKVKHKIHPSKLGSLKIEEECDDLEIVGPKSYIVKDRKVLKGVPKRAEQIGLLDFRYVTFQRQATHLRKNIVDHFEARRIEKHINNTYDKGVVTGTGRVRPFRLREF